MEVRGSLLRTCVKSLNLETRGTLVPIELGVSRQSVQKLEGATTKSATRMSGSPEERRPQVIEKKYKAVQKYFTNGYGQ